MNTDFHWNSLHGLVPTPANHKCWFLVVFLHLVPIQSKSRWWVLGSILYCHFHFFFFFCVLNCSGTHYSTDLALTYYWSYVLYHQQNLLLETNIIEGENRKLHPSCQLVYQLWYLHGMSALCALCLQCPPCSSNYF